MKALALSWWVAAPWQPSPAPPPTVWAEAGARGWLTCERLGQEAAAVLNPGTSQLRGSGEEDAGAWVTRVAQCPRVPELLILAARSELATAGDMGDIVHAPTNAAAVVLEHAARVRRALRWIDRALDESRRRAAAAPPESHFLRAYALVNLGRLDEADRALGAAVAGHEVAAWRSERMAAVIWLLRGELTRAVAAAHGALRRSPVDDQLVSRYIRAFAWDRAGAIAAAATEFRELHRHSAHVDARRATESLLPIHERLMLRALDAQARGDANTAAQLWDAYLARPEPQAPERELARRRRAGLRRQAAPAPVRPSLGPSS